MILLPAITSGQPLLDTIHHTDALTLLRGLPSDSINSIVTSPPYFGLRDYGMPNQIGLEKSPAEYVAKMVELFREARRVLKSDGTFWLNLGDSYNGSGKGAYHTDPNAMQRTNKGSLLDRPTNVDGLAPKNLLMIPARVAIALQDDGWYLRSEIIWHKPNAMPESAKDRPTKAHEMVYLLTKSPTYWYDWEAIREPIAESTGPRMLRGVSDHHKNIDGAPGQTPHSMNRPRGNRNAFRGGGAYTNNQAFDNSAGIPNAVQGNDGLLHTHRNKRTVWTIPTRPFSEAHFATFPPDLIEPMIKAGCPFGGIVLDPFMGSGTTAMVARELGRHYIGSELNPVYIEIAKKRLSVPYAVDMFLGQVG